MGRREKEYTAGEGCVLCQTGTCLLYVSSLAPTPVNCGKVFSWSRFLYLHGAIVFLAIFALGSISLLCHKVSIFPAGPQTAQQVVSFQWLSPVSLSICLQPPALPTSHCSQMKSQARILRQEWLMDRVILDREVLDSKETEREEASF